MGNEKVIRFIDLKVVKIRILFCLFINYIVATMLISVTNPIFILFIPGNYIYSFFCRSLFRCQVNNIIGDPKFSILLFNIFFLCFVMEFLFLIKRINLALKCKICLEKVKICFSDIIIFLICSIFLITLSIDFLVDSFYIIEYNSFISWFLTPLIFFLSYSILHSFSKLYIYQIVFQRYGIKKHFLNLAKNILYIILIIVYSFLSGFVGMLVI
jgi:hypothetical protein